MKPRNPRASRRRAPARHGAARIGLVTAVATVLCVLTAGPAPAHTRPADGVPGEGGPAAVTGVTSVPPARSEGRTSTAPAEPAGLTVTRAASPSETVVLARNEPAAEEESGSSAVVTWAIIIVGALLGIGIGLAIVSRATRKHAREQRKGGPR
ncbi:hypothetical protein ACFHW2_06010 [Actinomadura sp. LOL_016]|uniref:hypothetical protein n=1 Tax=unclassified Actinomadura TaxID=2626254 RepID=UPI003A807B80